MDRSIGVSCYLGHELRNLSEVNRLKNSLRSNEYEMIKKKCPSYVITSYHQLPVRMYSLDKFGHDFTGNHFQYLQHSVTLVLVD